MCVADWRREALRRAADDDRRWPALKFVFSRVISLLMERWRMGVGAVAAAVGGDVCVPEFFRMPSDELRLLSSFLDRTADVGQARSSTALTFGPRRIWAGRRVDRGVVDGGSHVLCKSAEAQRTCGLDVEECV